MHTRHEDERSTTAGPATPRFTVRQTANAVDAETLLPLLTLTRLCGNEKPGRARQDNVYRSSVIVVLDGDVPVGFAAFKSTAGLVRVAHELWVHAHVSGGPVPVTHALLNTLEAVCVRSMTR